MPFRVGALIPRRVAVGSLPEAQSYLPEAQWYRNPEAAGQPPLQAERATRDHSWEGGAIGAASLGLLALAFGAGSCNGDSGTRNCTYPLIGGFFVGALIGGVAGLFIGSGIPKGNPDSVEVKGTDGDADS